MNDETYESILKRQQLLKEESSRIVIDTSGRIKFRGLTSIEALGYVTGTTPYIQGGVYVVNDTVGAVSGGDRSWERDQHVILVKKRNELSKEEKTKFGEVISKHLAQGQLLKLITTMMARFENSIEGKSNVVFSLLSKCEKLISEKHDIKLSCKIIKLWLGNVIIGPFAITRTLANDFYKYLGDWIVDPLLRELKKNLKGLNFYDVNIDQITILDDKYFVFDHDEMMRVGWPNEINFDVVAVATPGRHIEKKRFTVETICESHHIHAGPDNEDTKFSFVVENCPHLDNYIITMDYGDLVFDGVDEQILAILQGKPFIDWCKDEDINLELWFGRNEREKIKDYGKLIQKVHELEIENERLRNE